MLVYQVRLPLTTWQDCGFPELMSETAESSSRIAAPSVARRLVALPMPDRTPLKRIVPGSTTRRFVPRLSSCALRAARAPSPTASMAIRAATPMKMPSIVSAERSLLRLMPRPAASNAIQRKDRASDSRDAGCPPARGAAAGGGGGRGGRCRVPLGSPLVGQDEAVADGDDAVGNLSHRPFVGDENDRQAAFAIERPDRPKNLLGRLRVEVARRLVGEQDRRVVDQGAGHRHALLLAAGELVGMVARALGEAEQGQRFAHLAGAAGPLTRVEERQRDVLGRTRARQQVEALEHEADPKAADARQRGLVQAGDVDPVEEVLAGGGLVETADDVHEGGLSRPRGSNDGDELAALDRQADSPEGVDLLVSQLIDRKSTRLNS